MENQTELRQKYNPEGSELRQLQLEMLEILITVDRICKKHNIPYWIEGGTLLGAVRHEGFIPWDDDLDIALMKRDYKKLIKILQDELPQEYALQTHDTDHNYFQPFAKVRSLSSEIEELNGYDRNYIYKGAYIDIFSMEKGFNTLSKVSSYIYYLLRKSSYKITNCFFRKTFLNAFYYIVKLIICVFKLCNFLFRPQRITYSYGVYFNCSYKYEQIFPISSIKFEGCIFNAPNDVNKYLIETFGNYKQLPPEESRKTHIHSYKKTNKNEVI